MKRIFSAPTCVNLEITDVCNVRCRHCYNFWRKSGSKKTSLDRDGASRMIDMLIDAGVFHVVLTGGEPFARFDVLEFAIEKLLRNNVTISCNSNLMLVTEDKIKRLRDLGLDHILTSLNSHIPEVNDAMVSSPGAFDKIIRGIRLCRKNGIRVSVNMIVSEKNRDHVYDTGRLVADLDCQKIFGTRVVPSVNLTQVTGTEFDLTKENALNTVNQLLRVKEDTGIMIGTLVSYPLCLLGDLEKFKDFVGRGCPGQSGHLMSINADGETHACAHQRESHGNIFTIGIQEAYKNMRAWHDQSYYYQGCEGCDYIDVCKTGCRMSAHAYYGRYDGKDHLMEGKDYVTRPYTIVYDRSIYENMDKGIAFTAPKRLRFRKEDGFYLLNIRWANTIVVPTKAAEFLMEHQKTGREFTARDFGAGNRALLASLYFKDAVECRQMMHRDLRGMEGLSADPANLK